MTQAIVLSKMLISNGHEIVHTFIGKSDRRSTPAYFFDQLDSEISELRSPNFILDKNNKSLKLGKSISHNARFLSTYKKSLYSIHQKVKETSPDAIVNFYDFLGGFYFRFYNPSNVRHICIGRQFLTLHPDYPFAPKRDIEKRLYLGNNRITSQKCDKYFALSFRPYAPCDIKKLVVAPPLIHANTSDEIIQGDFILAYMVNDGYAEEIISWHSQNPEVEVHCFWDRKNMPITHCPQPNLTFHQIDNLRFKEMMKRCAGYISTAGFESICEAMQLQKPAMMIPVKGQYEQACNAIDAEQSGAGISSDTFDISKLIAYLPNYRPNPGFMAWLDQAESIFIEELTNFNQ